MAAGDLRQGIGTPQIRFIAAAGFSPADAGTDMTIGTPTDITITRASLGVAAARQSNKGDLGALFATGFSVYGVVDFTGETPAAGTIDYYWASSFHATQATGNTAGNSGVDAAAPGGALGSITLAEFLLICDYIGSFAVHDGASVQGPALVNPRWFPPTRYGQLIEVNNSADIYEADEVEVHTVFNPLVPNVEQA